MKSPSESGFRFGFGFGFLVLFQPLGQCEKCCLKTDLFVEGSHHTLIRPVTSFSLDVKLPVVAGLSHWFDQISSYLGAIPPPSSTASRRGEDHEPAAHSKDHWMNGI